jgi:hypothetical protein
MGDREFEGGETFTGITLDPFFGGGVTARIIRQRGLLFIPDTEHEEEQLNPDGDAQDKRD